MAGTETVADSWRQACSLVAARPIAASLVAVAVVSAIFLLAPGIDLWFTGLFYRPGERFFLSRAPVLVSLRRFSDMVVILVAAWLVLQVILKLARPDEPSYVRPSLTLFLLSTLIVGPGLLVNLILKDNWGRPRPVMIEAFGGSAPYVEVWHMTDHCARNCSFVAGEASTGVWLMALALVVPPRWRLPVLIATGTWAVFLSLNRIAFGGHFLSDVLLSWALMALVIAVAWRFIIERPPPWLADAALEAGLTAAGRKLRRQA